MNFLADTIVVWTTRPTGTVATEIDDYVAEMTAQGLTDGVPHYILQPDGKFQVGRSWATVQAADAWVTFITALGPESAEVVLV